MRGDLSEEQVRTRFQQRVIPYLESLLANATGSRLWPTLLVYTAGQPGSGKSQANARATLARPSLVSVIGDDLRPFHPDYGRLMREDPGSMPRVTAQAAGRWVEMSANYLRERRADVLIETTLRSPTAMMRTITAFRQAGYVVELHALAVPPEVSRLGTIERYLRQAQESGAGRWTPSSIHDEAFVRAPYTIRELVQSGVIDRLVIENRTGATLFEQACIEAESLADAGHAAAAELKLARHLDRLTSTEAIHWLTVADTAAQACAHHPAWDPDVIATITRVVTQDARRIAQLAYPGDSGHQQQVLTSLRASLEPPSDAETRPDTTASDSQP